MQAGPRALPLVRSFRVRFLRLADQDQIIAMDHFLIKLRA